MTDRNSIKRKNENPYTSVKDSVVKYLYKVTAIPFFNEKISLVLCVAFIGFSFGFLFSNVYMTLLFGGCLMLLVTYVFILLLLSFVYRKEYKEQEVKIVYQKQ